MTREGKAMVRFKIIYLSRAWEPWELHEWCAQPGLFKRGRWCAIASGDTKAKMEECMAEIVRGEKNRAPSYYDHQGEPECAF